MSWESDPQYRAERGVELWEPVDVDVPEMRSRARELIGVPVGLAWEEDDYEDDDGDEADCPDGEDDDEDDYDEGWEGWEEWEAVEPVRPESLVELDRYDSIVALVSAPAAIPAAKRVRLPRVRSEHLAVIRWLDRFGCMTTYQLRQAVMRDAALRSTQSLLAAMRRAGLVRSRRTQLQIEEGRGRGGSAPRIWELTTAGFRLGQQSPGFVTSVIPRDRPLRRTEHETPVRLVHDLHAIGWWLAFRDAVKHTVEIGDVLTARYEDGKFAVPRMPYVHGRGSRPVELRDILLADHATFNGIPDPRFTGTIEPDLTIRLRFDASRLDLRDDLEVDLLVEFDRTQRPSYNRDKLERYDAFLTGWGLLHARVKELGTRPVVVFTSPNPRAMWALIKLADQVMTGRIGRIGDPEYQWYWAGREHTFFTTEEEIHNHTLRAWQLPEHPRSDLYESFGARPVTILPPELIRPRRDR